MAYDINSVVKRKKVLVVEDDPAIKYLYHDVLKKKGYEMILFDSGADAENYIRNGFSHDVTAAFFDHHLDDGVNGHKLAELSKRINPNVKTVCASGGVEAQIEDGVFDMILRKPFQEKGILWALGQTDIF